MTELTTTTVSLLALSLLIIPTTVGASADGNAGYEDSWRVSVTADTTGQDSSAPGYGVGISIPEFVSANAPCDPSVFCSTVIHACITACIQDSGGSYAEAECVVTEEKCKAVCKCKA